MNFVAGLLLMYLPERHAFGGLVVLMQDRGLRKYYSTDMSLIQVSGQPAEVGAAGRTGRSCSATCTTDGMLACAAVPCWWPLIT